MDMLRQLGGDPAVRQAASAAIDDIEQASAMRRKNLA